MSTWHNTENEKNNSPIDPVQYVMVAICDDIFDSKTDICQFQTSIYGNEDSVYLLEGESFSQYIFAGSNSQYIIDFSEEKAVTKVHVDIFVVSGDIDLNLNGNENLNINAHKYYLSNKIFYSISMNDNKGLKKIIADVKAKVNTYYIIEYKLVKGSENEKINDIYSGINYLVPVPKEVGANKKIINIHNVKILANDFYLASFYSLNCAAFSIPT